MFQALVEVIGELLRDIAFEFKKGALVAMACAAIAAYFFGLHGFFSGLLFGIGAGIFLETRLRFGRLWPAGSDTQKDLHWQLACGGSLLLGLGIIWFAQI